MLVQPMSWPRKRALPRTCPGFTGESENADAEWRTNESLGGLGS